MNHEGILSDQGILPERRHGGMIPTHRILSRLRRTLAVRVVAIVAALLLVSIPFATYARPGVMDEFAITRKVSETFSRRPERPPSPVEHKSHIPFRTADVFEPVRWSDFIGKDGLKSNTIIYGSEGTSGNGRASSDKNIAVDRTPKIHLVSAARESSPSLCRTLLSAAVLNYPPPVLINYGSTEDESRAIQDVIYKTYEFLAGGEVQDDDLTLIMGEGNWFQLPAEVTISRFLSRIKTSDAKLLDKYGRKPPQMNLNSGVVPLGSPRYTQSVLYGAQKECPNSPDDVACHSAPQSLLLTEIYGPQPEGYPGSKIDLPRYLGPPTSIGRAADLRSIYSHSKDIFEASAGELYNHQQILARIFGKQEYVRCVRADVFKHKSQVPVFAPGLDNGRNIKLGTNYEFGIGLDYTASVFQDLGNSATDMRFVAFKDPPIIAWPSLPPTSAFENLMQLPQDLAMSSPFASPRASMPGSTPPLHPDLDNLPAENVTWPDVELLTNIIVPSSSVPAVVNLRGNGTLQEEWWRKMWFQPFGRALLRQQLRSPKHGVAMDGGRQRWDFRGGKGGVWTDNGTWLDWNEVCGGFEEEVFGDGRGRFGAEM